MTFTRECAREEGAHEDGFLPQKPPAPSPVLTLDKGWVKHLEEHICHLGLHVARQKKSVSGLNAPFLRDWDVSKHRLPCVGEIRHSQS